MHALGEIVCLRGGLTPLSTPTRVLLGADDPNVRPEFIHGVEDHVDALHTEIVVGASHLIVDDVPGVVVAQALDFFTP